MTTLPIDALRADILAALREHPSLVLEAPPGAGKTTRLPRFLLDDGWAERGEIVVLQPRRIAARMAARFVASELSEEVGRRVGYQVRFEEAVSRETRVRFVTEGLLVRRLLARPTLDGVACVVLDEFHERHLDSDLALALLAALQRGPRPDLKVVVMSATLDAEPIAEWLGDCPRLRSEGRRFEVSIQYNERPDARPLEQQVAGAVRRALAADPDGDVLVFLPGVGEINRAREACAGVAATVLPLHGELPPAEQDRAVRRAGGRKVILSTNVAETSVTIDGVTTVIDTGLARVARHDPWSGLPVLEVKRVSQASATQRAGRAGRTRAGRALRLYTQADYAGMAPFEKPELTRLDLAGTSLLVRALGHDPRALDWLEPPPPQALEAADTLLRALHAVDGAGALTPIGRRMLDFPVHPRQARVILDALERGVGAEACLCAAVLSERDVRMRRGADVVAAASDVLEIAERVEALERGRFDVRLADQLGLRAGSARMIVRARDQLLRAARPGPSRADVEVPLRKSLLAGYVDRVAMRRPGSVPPGTDAPLVLAAGGSAKLSRDSVAQHATWLVALDAEERDRREPLVRSASAIEPDWLIEVAPESIVESKGLEWNTGAERVDEVARMSYGALTLDEQRRPAAPSHEAAAILFDQIEKSGTHRFIDAEALASLGQRVELLRRERPDLAPPPIGEVLTKVIEEALHDTVSFAALREAALLELVRVAIGAELDRLAPERLTLASGRTVVIHYEAGRPPWVESYLQDFFGTDRTPAIAAGRVPLTLHLLAPNKRPVQVTQDLASFWDTHYPSLKKELSRRYPKHQWPDDPRRAEPRALKRKP